MNKVIDIRSDSVTKPSEEMKRYMIQAEVGDDVYGEDPTARKLEEYFAELAGKENALFVPSGTMANQLALKILSEPGDEIICESDSHIFIYESGSPAILSGLQMFPIKGENGVLPPNEVVKAIRPSDAYYMPRTKIIEIENTHNRAGGSIVPLENIIALREIANYHKLKMHLDGSRLWHASVETGISIKEYAQYFDTIACCLSKGLGAPVGSLIAASSELIEKARRFRKAWGGGMRQIGMLAAAGLFALLKNVQRLKEDHLKARLFADIIESGDLVKIINYKPQTNIVLFEIINDKISENRFIHSLRQEGVLISQSKEKTLRAVFHLDVSMQDSEIAAFKILNLLKRL